MKEENEVYKISIAFFILFTNGKPLMTATPIEKSPKKVKDIAMETMLVENSNVPKREKNVKTLSTVYVDFIDFIGTADKLIVDITRQVKIEAQMMGIPYYDKIKIKDFLSYPKIKRVMKHD